MKEIVLEKNGTVLIDEKRIEFSEFEKLFKEEPFGILDSTFDGKELCFIITMLKEEGEVLYKLKLSPEREVLLKKGIIDKDVEKLLDLTKAKKQQNKMREVDGKVIKEDEYPNDKKTLEEYKKYLEEQIKATKTNISAAISYSFVLYALTGGVLALCWQVISLGIGGIALAMLIFPASIAPMVLTPWKVWPEIKDESKKFCSYLDRVKKVKEKLKELKLSSKEVPDEEIIDNYNYPINAKDKKIEILEIREIFKIELDFFNEIAETGDLISKLPNKETADEYRKELHELLEEYLNGLNSIMVNENKTKIISFAGSKNFLSLNREMMEKVKLLESVVRKLLVDCESLGNIQGAEEVITSLSGQKGYVDGYNDGYIEGFGDTGVAYATFPENEETFEHGVIGR